LPDLCFIDPLVNEVRLKESEGGGVLARQTHHCAIVETRNENWRFRNRETAATSLAPLRNVAAVRYQAPPQRRCEYQPPKSSPQQGKDWMPIRGQDSKLTDTV